MNDDDYALFQALADIPALKARFPEVQLLDLERWLREEGWQKRARKITAQKG